MRDSLKQFQEDPCGTHPGLVLERLLPTVADATRIEPDDRDKLLKNVVAASRAPEFQPLYRLAFDRWKSLSDSLTSRECCLSTSGRMIVGLGIGNSIETGIRLHHTYGVPVIPGSALKGLAAHWCDRVWGGYESDEPRDGMEDYRIGGKYHRLIFGTTEDSGVITFEDAWLTPASLESELGPLRRDVMTPHHLRWQTGQAAPTDFDDPNPVPFLSVSGEFAFRIVWSGPSDAAPELIGGWLDRVLDLLTLALADWGIGSKTSSGYGRFDVEKWRKDSARAAAEKERLDLERAEAEQRELRLSAMSPLQRAISEYLESHPNKTSPDYMKLWEELKKGGNCRWQGADRIEVAQQVKSGMIEAKKWDTKKSAKDYDRTKFIKEILGES